MPHDALEVINHQLVAEVSKTTVATIMLLASSPSRLTDLRVAGLTGGAADITWTASPEKGVVSYVVEYGPAADPALHHVLVTAPHVRLTGIGGGTTVRVKAVNARGLQGWDWARVTVK